MAVSAVFLTGLFFKDEIKDNKRAISSPKNSQNGEFDVQEKKFSVEGECSEEEEHMFVGCNGFF